MFQLQGATLYPVADPRKKSVPLAAALCVFLHSILLFPLCAVSSGVTTITFTASDEWYFDQVSQLEYMYHDKALHFFSAKSYCESFGGSLVSSISPTSGTPDELTYWTGLRVVSSSTLPGSNDAYFYSGASVRANWGDDVSVKTGVNLADQCFAVDTTTCGSYSCTDEAVKFPAMCERSPIQGHFLYNRSYPVMDVWLVSARLSRADAKKFCKDKLGATLAYLPASDITDEIGKMMYKVPRLVKNGTDPTDRCPNCPKGVWVGASPNSGNIEYDSEGRYASEYDVDLAVASVDSLSGVSDCLYLELDGSGMTSLLRASIPCTTLLPSVCSRLRFNITLSFNDRAYNSGANQMTVIAGTYYDALFANITLQQRFSLARQSSIDTFIYVTSNNTAVAHAVPSHALLSHCTDVPPENCNSFVNFAVTTDDSVTEITYVSLTLSLDESIPSLNHEIQIDPQNEVVVVVLPMPTAQFGGGSETFTVVPGSSERRSITLSEPYDSSLFPFEIVPATDSENCTVFKIYPFENGNPTTWLTVYGIRPCEQKDYLFHVVPNHEKNSLFTVGKPVASLTSTPLTITVASTLSTSVTWPRLYLYDGGVDTPLLADAELNADPPDSFPITLTLSTNCSEILSFNETLTWSLGSPLSSLLVITASSIQIKEMFCEVNFTVNSIEACSPPPRQILQVRQQLTIDFEFFPISLKVDFSIDYTLSVPYFWEDVDTATVSFSPSPTCGCLPQPSIDSVTLNAVRLRDRATVTVADATTGATIADVCDIDMSITGGSAASFRPVSKQRKLTVRMYSGKKALLVLFPKNDPTYSSSSYAATRLLMRFTEAEFVIFRDANTFISLTVSVTGCSLSSSTRNDEEFSLVPDESTYETIVDVTCQTSERSVSIRASLPGSKFITPVVESYNVVAKEVIEIEEMPPFRQSVFLNVPRKYKVRLPKKLRSGTLTLTAQKTSYASDFTIEPPSLTWGSDNADYLPRYFTVTATTPLMSGAKIGFRFLSSTTLEYGYGNAVETFSRKVDPSRTVTISSNSALLNPKSDTTDVYVDIDEDLTDSTVVTLTLAPFCTSFASLASTEVTLPGNYDRSQTTLTVTDAPPSGFVAIYVTSVVYSYAGSDCCSVTGNLTIPLKGSNVVHAAVTNPSRRFYLPSETIEMTVGILGIPFAGPDQTVAVSMDPPDIGSLSASSLTLPADTVFTVELPSSWSSPENPLFFRVIFSPASDEQFRGNSTSVVLVAPGLFPQLAQIKTELLMGSSFPGDQLQLRLGYPIDADVPTATPVIRSTERSPLIPSAPETFTSTSLLSASWQLQMSMPSFCTPGFTLSAGSPIYSEGYNMTPKQAWPIRTYPKFHVGFSAIESPMQEGSRGAQTFHVWAAYHPLLKYASVFTVHVYLRVSGENVSFALFNQTTFSITKDGYQNPTLLNGLDGVPVHLRGLGPSKITFYWETDQPTYYETSTPFQLDILPLRQWYVQCKDYVIYGVSDWLDCVAVNIDPRPSEPDFVRITMSFNDSFPSLTTNLTGNKFVFDATTYKVFFTVNFSNSVTNPVNTTISFALSGPNEYQYLELDPILVELKQQKSCYLNISRRLMSGEPYTFVGDFQRAAVLDCPKLPSPDDKLLLSFDCVEKSSPGTSVPCDFSVPVATFTSKNTSTILPFSFSVRLPEDSPKNISLRATVQSSALESPEFYPVNVFTFDVIVFPRIPIALSTVVGLRFVPAFRNATANLSTSFTELEAGENITVNVTCNRSDFIISPSILVFTNTGVETNPLSFTFGPSDSFSEDLQNTGFTTTPLLREGFSIFFEVIAPPQFLDRVSPESIADLETGPLRMSVIKPAPEHRFIFANAENIYYVNVSVDYPTNTHYADPDEIVDLEVNCNETQITTVGSNVTFNRTDLSAILFMNVDPLLDRMLTVNCNYSFTGNAAYEYYSEVTSTANSLISVARPQAEIIAHYNKEMYKNQIQSMVLRPSVPLEEMCVRYSTNVSAELVAHSSLKNSASNAPFSPHIAKLNFDVLPSYETAYITASARNYTIEMTIGGTCYGYNRNTTELPLRVVEPATITFFDIPQRTYVQEQAKIIVQFAPVIDFLESEKVFKVAMKLDDAPGGRECDPRGITISGDNVEQDENDERTYGLQVFTQNTTFNETIFFTGEEDGTDGCALRVAGLNPPEYKDIFQTILFHPNRKWTYVIPLIPCKYASDNNFVDRVFLASKKHFEVFNNETFSIEITYNRTGEPQDAAIEYAFTHPGLVLLRNETTRTSAKLEFRFYFQVVLNETENFDGPLDFLLFQKHHVYLAPSNFTVYVGHPQNVSIETIPEKIRQGPLNNRTLSLKLAKIPTRPVAVKIEFFPLDSVCGEARIVCMKSDTIEWEANTVGSLVRSVTIEVVNHAYFDCRNRVSFTLFTNDYRMENTDVSIKIIPLGELIVEGATSVLFEKQSFTLRLSLSHPPLQHNLSVSVSMDVPEGTRSPIDVESVGEVPFWSPAIEYQDKLLELFARNRIEQRDMLYDLHDNPEYVKKFKCANNSDTCESLKIIQGANVVVLNETDKILYVGEIYHVFLTLQNCTKSIIRIQPILFDFSNAVRFFPTELVVDCDQEKFANFTVEGRRIESSPNEDPTPRFVNLYVDTEQKDTSSDAYPLVRTTALGGARVQVRIPLNVSVEFSSNFLFSVSTVQVKLQLPRPPTRGNLNAKIVFDAPRGIVATPSTLEWLEDSEWVKGQDPDISPQTIELKWDEAFYKDQDPEKLNETPSQVSFILSGNNTADEEFTLAGSWELFLRWSLSVSVSESIKGNIFYVNSTLRIPVVLEIDGDDIGPGEDGILRISLNVQRDDASTTTVPPKVLLGVMAYSGNETEQNFTFIAYEPGAHTLIFTVDSSKMKRQKYDNSSFEYHISVANRIGVNIEADNSPMNWCDGHTCDLYGFQRGTLNVSLLLDDTQQYNGDSLTVSCGSLVYDALLTVRPTQLTLNPTDKSWGEIAIWRNVQGASKNSLLVQFKDLPAAYSATDEVFSLSFLSRRTFSRSFSVSTLYSNNAAILTLSVPNDGVKMNDEQTVSVECAFFGTTSATVSPSNFTLNLENPSPQKLSLFFTDAGSYTLSCEYPAKEEELTPPSLESSPLRIPVVVQPQLQLFFTRSSIGGEATSGGGSSTRQPLSIIEMFTGKANSINILLNAPLPFPAQNKQVVAELLSTDTSYVKITAPPFIVLSDQIPTSVPIAVEGLKPTPTNSNASILITTRENSLFKGRATIPVKILPLYGYTVFPALPKVLHSGPRNTISFTVGPNAPVQGLLLLRPSMLCDAAVASPTVLQWNSSTEVQTIKLLGRGQESNCSLAVVQDTILRNSKFGEVAVMHSLEIIPAPQLTSQIFYRGNTTGKVPASALRVSASQNYLIIRLILSFASFESRMFERGGNSSLQTCVRLAANKTKLKEEGIEGEEEGISMYLDAASSAEVEFVSVSLEQNNQTLTVSLKPYHAFVSLPFEEQVIVSVDPQCIVGNVALDDDYSHVVFTLMPETRDSILRVDRQVLDSSMLTAAALSSFLSLSATSHPGKILFLTDLLHCSTEKWIDAQDDLPIQYALTSVKVTSNENLGVYAGAVFFNLFLFVILTIAQTSFWTIVFKLRKRQQSRHRNEEHVEVSELRRSAKGFARFPMLLWIPVFLYYQTTLSMSLQLIFYSPNTALKIIGSAVVAFLFLAFPLAAYRLHRRAKDVLEYIRPQRKGIWGWLFGKGRFTCDTDNTWLKRHGLPITLYRIESLWYLFVEVCSMVSLGFIFAVEPDDHSGCLTKSGCVLAVHVINMVVVIMFQPYSRKSDNLFFMFATALEVEVASMTFYYILQKENPDEAAIKIDSNCLAIAVLFLLKALLDWFQACLSAASFLALDGGAEKTFAKARTMTLDDYRMNLLETTMNNAGNAAGEEGADESKRGILQLPEPPDNRKSNNNGAENSEEMIDLSQMSNKPPPAQKHHRPCEAASLSTATLLPPAPGTTRPRVLTGFQRVFDPAYDALDALHQNQSHVVREVQPKQSVARSLFQSTTRKQETFNFEEI